MGVKPLCEEVNSECSGTVSYRGPLGWMCDGHYQHVRGTVHHAKKLAIEARRRRRPRDTD